MEIRIVELGVFVCWVGILVSVIVLEMVGMVLKIREFVVVKVDKSLVVSFFVVVWGNFMFDGISVLVLDFWWWVFFVVVWGNFLFDGISVVMLDFVCEVFFLEEDLGLEKLLC